MHHGDEFVICNFFAAGASNGALVQNKKPYCQNWNLGMRGFIELEGLALNFDSCFGKI
jgi:hypothetical protein